MIRECWSITGAKTLKDEIDAIKDKVDPLTWQAIDSVRSVGNIGAHMERDVHQIVDVEPDEAAMLISLIERLLQDWYVVPHERQLESQILIQMAESKRNRPQ